MIKNVEEYLNNFFRGTKNPSLHAMKYFMEEYNNFEKEMKFIHIAGTNGKGSCTEMISNILVKQGYKVGKFLSPHLIKYNERISINRQDISDEDLISLITELEPKIKKYNENNNVDITLFELETIMGLLYFYRNKVDFVVLETGLGGIYDCTNIITKPLVSIITSIGYDHIQILGDTLEEIATQKAGIIKENSNTIIFENNKKVDDIFVRTCKDKNNKLCILRKYNIHNYNYDNQFQYFDYKNYKNIAINLKGMCQPHNAIISIKCMGILNDLGYKISENSIREGLSTVIHKARFEEIHKEPLIIYDGGHNEQAINNLKQSIKMYYKDYKKIYVISILMRKDYNKMLKMLLEDDANSTFIFTSGNDEKRYTPKQILYNTSKKYKKEEQQIYAKTLEAGIREVMNIKEKNTVTFVIGSFYIYGDVDKLIKEN